MIELDLLIGFRNLAAVTRQPLQKQMQTRMLQLECLIGNAQNHPVDQGLVFIHQLPAFVFPRQDPSQIQAELATPPQTDGIPHSRSKIRLVT